MNKTKKDFSIDKRSKDDRIREARTHARSPRQRHQDALQTAIDRGTISPQEQLQRLDWRLGVSQGARRERTRLMAKLTPQESEQSKS